MKMGKMLHKKNDKEECLYVILPRMFNATVQTMCEIFLYTKNMNIIWK